MVTDQHWRTECAYNYPLYPEHCPIADHLLASRHGRLADDVLCESLKDELEYDSSTTVPSDDAFQDDTRRHFIILDETRGAE